MKKTVLILSFLACALMSSAESRVWVSPLEIMPGEHSYSLPGVTYGGVDVDGELIPSSRRDYFWGDEEAED